MRDGQFSKTAQERQDDQQQKRTTRVLTINQLPAQRESYTERGAVGTTHLEQKSTRSTRFTLSMLPPTSKKHSDLLLVSLDPRHESATTQHMHRTLTF